MEEIKKRENKKAYDKQIRWQVLYPVITLAAMLVTALLFSLNWVSVYNTDMVGNEVEVTGLNCLIALITDGFSSTAEGVGDMAVPFYYYAKGECETLSLVTLLSAITLALTVVLLLVEIYGKKHSLAAINAALSLITAVLLVVAYAVALSMQGGKILPIYCGGNPACSIRSMAIIPAIVGFIGAAVGLLGAVNYYSLNKLLS